MAFVMAVGMLSSPLGQAIYGSAYEYLIGYESFIIMGAVGVAILVSLYARRISEC